MQSPLISRLLDPLRVSVLMLLSWCASASAAGDAIGPALEAQVAEAARSQVLDAARATGLAEPQAAVTVIGGRGREAACARAERVEAVDTRHPSRMRFAVHCAGAAPVEFVVKATVSAKVVVAVATIESGRPIVAEDLAVERRLLVGSVEPLSELQEIVGQSSRRALRAGRIVDKRWLEAPVLVRRGASVRIVARRGTIAVSAPGEALESGRRDEIVSVRNAETGSVIQARVTAGNVVEPVGIP